MQPLPTGAPQTAGEASAFLDGLDDPSPDDLIAMVLLEASGRAFYEHMASCVDNAAARDLLKRNGREELAHAHRVSRAIGKLTGADYPVPSDTENPYLAGPMPPMDVSAQFLSSLAAGEMRGEALYEKWATNCANAEVAELFRQNACEEARHAVRLGEAAALMSGQDM